MEHSIDLAACHFVQEVSPSSTSKLLKKIKKAFVGADISDTDIDLDELDSHLAGFNFTIADSIGKALALVKQVSLLFWCCNLHPWLIPHRSARAFFKNSRKKVDVPYSQLILWIRTRWASLFTFLDRTLTLKKVSQLQKSSKHDSDEFIAYISLCSICGGEWWGSQAQREKLLWLLPPETWLGEAWVDAWSFTGQFGITHFYFLLFIASRNQLAQSKHFRAWKSQALSEQSRF